MPRKKKLNLTEVNELLASYQSQQTQLDFQQSQIQGVIADLKKEQSALAKKDSATTKAPAKRRGRPATKRKAASSTKRASKASTKKTSTAKAKAAPAKKAAAKKPGRRPGRPAGSKNKSTAAKATTKKSTTAKTKTAAKAKTKAKAPAKARAKKSASSAGYRLSPWDEVLLNALQASSTPMRKSDLDDLFKGHPLAKKAKMNAEGIYSKVSRVLHKLANKRGVVKKVPTEGKGFAYTMA